MRELLVGGDRRSIARADEALRMARGNERRIEELAKLAREADPLVAMRAFDILDKLAHENPAWVQRHSALFAGPASTHPWWEVRLQIARTLPLLRWTPRGRKRAAEVLMIYAHDEQRFVRAWALDGLARLAEHDATLAAPVERLLQAFERSGSPALRARSRAIRERQREAEKAVRRRRITPPRSSRRA